MNSSIENNKLILNDQQGCNCKKILFHHNEITSKPGEDTQNCLLINENSQNIITIFYVIEGKEKDKLKKKLINSLEKRKKLKKYEFDHTKTIEFNLNNHILILTDEIKEYLFINYNQQREAKTINDLLKILENNHINYYHNKNITKMENINPIFEDIIKNGIYIYHCSIIKNLKILTIPYILILKFGDGLL